MNQRQENRDFDTDGLMLPPWIRLPELGNHCSLGWRMGEGEWYWEQFKLWWRVQPQDMRDKVRHVYPATGDWAGFYGWLVEPQILNRLSAGIIGALVGDAVGVQFEFKAPERIPPLHTIQMVMPDTFEKSHYAIPSGTWSDDGAQLLCLLDALNKGHGGDATDLFDALPKIFAALMIRWMNEGYHQSGKVVFDCGMQTGRSLCMIEQGSDPLRAGGSDYRSNGNGALMRTLPVVVHGMRNGWSTLEYVRMAHLQSRITHAHPISQTCCALYCLFARRMLEDEFADTIDDYVGAAADELSRLHAERSMGAHRDALKEILDFPKTSFAKGSGFVVDTFWTALACMKNANSYVDVIRQAIGYGNDTDTTACVAGGLAGFKYGLNVDADANDAGIPLDWVNSLIFPGESTALLKSVFPKLSFSPGLLVMSGNTVQ